MNRWIGRVWPTLRRRAVWLLVAHLISLVLCFLVTTPLSLQVGIYRSLHGPRGDAPLFDRGALLLVDLVHAQRQSLLAALRASALGWILVAAGGTVLAMVTLIALRQPGRLCSWHLSVRLGNLLRPFFGLSLMALVAWLAWTWMTVQMVGLAQAWLFAWLGVVGVMRVQILLVGLGLGGLGLGLVLFDLSRAALVVQPLGVTAAIRRALGRLRKAPGRVLGTAALWGFPAALVRLGAVTLVLGLDWQTQGTMWLLAAWLCLHASALLAWFLRAAWWCVALGVVAPEVPE